MDSYEQSHQFIRPPPPPPPPYMADPHLNHSHHHHHAPPPPSQAVPPQAPWYPNQFQYHQSSQPPQWAPLPHSDHPPQPPYPAHPMTPYHAQPQFPPPPPGALPPRPSPPPPPPPPPQSQISQPYPQVNQEWGNSNWVHRQGWEYPAHNNEEDWAARARAWAAAKAAMENQHSQSHFPPIVRPDEQSQTQYHDQYPQAVDPHYPDFQQPSFSASSYQHYSVPPGPVHRPTAVHHTQEPTSIGAESSMYPPDTHLPYRIRDGTVTWESSAAFPHQETLPASSTTDSALQEVPSSYSSIAGKADTADKDEQLRNFPSAVSSGLHGQHSMQPSVPPYGRSVSMEQPHFAYGNQSFGPKTDLADQPLDFVPRFNHEHDPHLQTGYFHPDSVGSVRSSDPVSALPIHSWTPTVLPPTTYPPVGPQHDPSMALPPVSGHSAPIIGTIAGQNLQPPVPSASSTFSVGAGALLHPTTGFSGDVYGVSGLPERPKKASVPNWLREEIIKKAVITSSSQEHPKNETQSLEDEAADNSVLKGDQADSRSLESSRSTEEDDEDEDYDEAARTAAINQEIKRVLTEVLSKVTDELFDEIATRVINENDSTSEVGEADPSINDLNHKTSRFPTSAAGVKASAKVLIPVKARESESEDVNRKPISHLPGDVLGLASYASDDDDADPDDDGDESQSSRMPSSRKNEVYHQSDSKQVSDNNAVENGSIQSDTDHDKARLNGESDPSATVPVGVKSNSISAGVSKLSHNNLNRESEVCKVGTSNSSKGSSELGKHEIGVDGGRKAFEGSTIDEKIGMKPTVQEEVLVDDSRGTIPNDNAKQESTSFTGKDVAKKSANDIKLDENRGKQDGKHPRKEKGDERNGTKEKPREHGVKYDDKPKNTDSRKRYSHHNAKEDRKETDRVRSVDREETSRKRERAKDEKEDKLRHKPVNESIRHKKRRSSSPRSRGKYNKDNSTVSHANDSSDDASEDSERKLRSRKRNSSPSPSRSKRRQVSRSPHSKRSQRRHSPYSSLEMARGRRSRSKSPARWRR